MGSNEGLKFLVENEEFANGHWQKEMPTKPGKYATATRLGEEGPDVVVYLHPSDNSPTPVLEWAGWWWSVPYPDLPPAPKKWEGD